MKTETERTVLSPESKAALERGQQLSGKQATQTDQLATAQKAKADAEAEQQRAANQADSIRADEERKAVEAAKFQHEQAQARFVEANERALQKIDRAEKAVDLANAQAGQDYWADKSTGFKIIQALLTASSIKDSNTLGQDPSNSPFMQMTREAVARDKDKKLAAVRASKEFLEAARKGPEEARQFLLDAKADIDASTNRQLLITLKKAEAVKASKKLDPKLVQTYLDAAHAEIDANRLENQQTLTARDLQRGALLDRKQTVTALPGEKPKAPALVRWQGTDYNVGDEVTARKLQDRVGATETLNGQLDKLAALLEEGASPLTTGERRSKIDTQIAILTGNIKESKQLGALDRGVQTLVGSMVNDPTSIKNWLFKGGAKGALASIQAIKEEARSSIDNGLSAIPTTGFKPRQEPAGNRFANVTAAQLEKVILKATKAGDTKALGDARAALAALKKKGN